MKALILAGGKGTRLKGIMGDLPKPLFPIAGKPLLEHIISLCVKNSISEIHLLTGYGSEAIKKVIGDGKRLGANVFHHPDKQPLGTAGSVKELEHILIDDFLVLYGDVYLDMDIKRLITFHEQSKADATIVVHPNDHPYDSDLIETVDDNVVVFHPKPHPKGEFFYNRVNAAVYILSPKILRHIPKNIQSDFGRDIFLKSLADGDKICAYNTPEYLKDIGTPERYAKVCDDYKTGRPSQFNLVNQRRCVFLDRDGTINKFVPFLNAPSQFELIDGTAEAIKLLNNSDFLAIVVTNQPQIARGELSVEGLSAINKKMEHLLGLQHAKLDATYYCPHHPDTGFKGEVRDLKIKCECRKPSGGLFFNAAQRFNISIADSFVVGDSTLDIASARTIGAKAILVQTGLAGRDGKYMQVAPDFIFPDLLSAVKHIVTEGK